MALAFIDPQNLDRLLAAREPVAPRQMRQHAAGGGLRFGTVLAAVLIAHGALLAVLNIFELGPVVPDPVHEISVDLVSAPEADKAETPQSKAAPQKSGQETSKGTSK